jgi:anaerobic magnesium-protoporphyrin IX monomethyl ester cyclase
MVITFRRRVRTGTHACGGLETGPMKVLIAYPDCLSERLHTEDVRVPPLGVYYIAAMLRAQGIPAEILNAHGMRQAPEALRERLAAEAPDLLGISVLQANRWGGIEMARLAKALRPETITVFGGIGATTLWEHFLRHFPEVDFVVTGEGEQAFLEIAQALGRGQPEAIQVIPGVAWRRDGRPVRNPGPPPVEDLDGLPDPALYFPFQHVALSRGCPSACRFCGSPGFWGRKVRFHSPGYFVDQLERLARRGVRFFYVCDDTFTLKGRVVREVCRRIIDQGLAISWAAISRVDAVDRDKLIWMRRAGCIQVSFGVESGDPHIRAYLGKTMDEETIAEAFHLTARCGILPRAYLIYGCPGETDATVERNLALLRRIRPLSAIFYVLTLFPGTRLYEDYRRRAGVTDDIWLDPVEDILYCQTDPRLPAAKVLDWGRRLREGYHRMLPEIVAALELEAQPELRPHHADFLSRLGMTFQQGDYARVPEIPGKARLAETLHRRALEYHPHPRAYLGLALLHQQRRDFAAADAVMAEGLGHFANDEALHLCQALGRMNQGDFAGALALLEPLGDSPQALAYIGECLGALGQHQRAEAVRRRLRSP